MIVVSIGFDGKTVAEDLNIKEALRTGSYGYKLDAKGMIGNIISELRSLDNKHISKAISLAKSSTTPDNAAKKIRNIVATYKQCMDLYTQRNARFKAGDESIREIVKSYFYSEEGKKGIIPVEPIKICNDYSWNKLKGTSKSFSEFQSVPRVLSIEIGKDLSIGEARLFSIEVTLGYSNNKGAAQEVFTEVSKHTVNFTMERLDD